MGLQGSRVQIPPSRFGEPPLGCSLRRIRFSKPLGDTLRVLILLASAGLFACGGSADRDSSRPAAGFSARPEVDTTAMTKPPSGLRYQDITEGQGATAVADRTVSVHYTGWLPNGEKFDSSRDRNQ